MVSLTVPIWLSLMSTVLVDFSLIPRATNFVLVTYRSSPTIWTLLPSAAVWARKPSQSFSARPSSIETMGYADPVGIEPGHLIAALAALAWLGEVVSAILVERTGCRSSAMATSLPVPV